MKINHVLVDFDRVLGHEPGTERRGLGPRRSWAAEVGGGADAAMEHVICRWTQCVRKTGTSQVAVFQMAAAVRDNVLLHHRERPRDGPSILQTAPPRVSVFLR